MQCHNLRRRRGCAYQAGLPVSSVIGLAVGGAGLLVLSLLAVVAIHKGCPHAVATHPGSDQSDPVVCDLWVTYDGIARVSSDGP